MTARDLSTSAGVLAFAQSRRQEMANLFHRLGRFESNGYSFEAYCFATHAVRPSEDGSLEGWRTGKKLDRVEPLICRMPVEAHLFVAPERITTLMGHTIRHYARLSRAIGVLFMTEMWHVRTEAQGRSPDEVRDELPKNLEDAPGRGEALALWVEHSATGHRSWTAEIKRNPTALEPWQEQHVEPVKGRLINIVDWRS